MNGHAYSVAGGRIARIIVAETHGVVLAENTSEAIRDHLPLIDQLDVSEYHQPTSLEDEMAIIAKALSQAS